MGGRRLFKSFCLTFLLAFMVPVLPIWGTATAQASGGDCPPYDPMMAEQPGWLETLPLECRVEYSAIEGSWVNTDVVGQALSPGPDDYGYTSETATYNWMAADTQITSWRDAWDCMKVTDAIPIGFEFPFYENSYGSLFVSTTGLITFGWVDTISYLRLNSSIPDNENGISNLVAPLWDDLCAGAPYNSGGVYYAQGGTAPDRYFIVEWRDVTYNEDDTSTPFSFEAILYENGDILVQHQSLPPTYSATTGIEDSTGTDGLQYAYGTGLSAPEAILFDYPAPPTARVKITPKLQAQFTSPGNTSEFSFSVTNAGSIGPDRYDFVSPGSTTWSFELFSSDGVTPLTDTDSSGFIDIGEISQGASSTVVAKFTPPLTAAVGDYLNWMVTVRSAVEPAKTGLVTFQLSIPASHVGIYSYAGITGPAFIQGMSFMVATPAGTTSGKVADDHNYALAMAKTRDGDYLYVWSNYYEIHYALFGKDGSIVKADTPLTVFSSSQILDQSPSVSVAPNGMMGIAWVHKEHNASYEWNDNIYLAILDPAGDLAQGPVQVTDNTGWTTYDDSDWIRFYSTSLAETSDNHFILSWTQSGEVGDNIWYAVHDTAGTPVLAPTAFTSGNVSIVSAFNSIPGNKAILTIRDYPPSGTGNVHFAVIDSNGGIFKGDTQIGAEISNDLVDAVALPGGKTAVGWTHEGGISYVILDSGFNVIAGPTSANLEPAALFRSQVSLSMTTGGMDRVVFQWGGYTFRNEPAILYALGDSNGVFITPPLVSLIQNVDTYLYLSDNGQGIASYETFADVPTTYWSWSYIERLYAAGITGGCGTAPLIYCPEATVTRGQMAVFLERGMNGSSYSPPAATGMVFGDIPVSYWSAAWVEKLYADGITGGCGGGNYCPEQQVSRAQMAVFLLRAKHGSSYSPPPATGDFGDVPTSYWAASWIEQLTGDGITSGCGGGNYCPEQPVSRAQMAVFLVRTFNLP